MHFEARPVYGSGDVGHLLGYHADWVKKLYRRGEIPGYLLPGGRTWRIAHEQLIRWLEAHPEHAGALRRLREAEGGGL
jgi:excisionase family DNA binding protein